METVTLVRNELGPLLDRLIMQLEREGNLTYRCLLYTSDAADES